MSNPNLDSRYTKPADVDAKIAAQAVADAGQYTQQWKANTTYSSGQVVIAPDGSTVQANTGFTSSSTYSASNWTVLSPTVSTIGGTYAPLSSPTFTGVPIAPVPSAGTNNGQIATTSFVQASIAQATNGAAVYNPSPLHQGLLGWTVDPLQITNSYGIGTGKVYLFKMAWPVTGTITNIFTALSSGGSGLVNCYCAIYSSSGALLGQSADQSGSWTTSGNKTVPLTSAINVTGSSTTFLYASILIGQGTTTAPSLQRTPGGLSTALNNINLAVAASRSANFGSSLTSPPNLITMSSVAQEQYMAFFAVN